MIVQCFINLSARTNLLNDFFQQSNQKNLGNQFFPKRFFVSQRKKSQLSGHIDPGKILVNVCGRQLVDIWELGPGTAESSCHSCS